MSDIYTSYDCMEDIRIGLKSLGTNDLNTIKELVNNEMIQRNKDWMLSNPNVSKILSKEEIEFALRDSKVRLTDKRREQLEKWLKFYDTAKYWNKHHEELIRIVKEANNEFEFEVPELERTPEPERKHLEDALGFVRWPNKDEVDATREKRLLAKNNPTEVPDNTFMRFVEEKKRRYNLNRGIVDTQKIEPEPIDDVDLE